MGWSRQDNPPAPYKGTPGQSKAVVSTRVDSGQLLEVIKGFEPETWLAACLCAPHPLEPPLSNSLQAQPQWGLYFDFWAPGEPRHFLFISAGDRSQETQGNSEKEQICQLVVRQRRQLDCSPGHRV